MGEVKSASSAEYLLNLLLQRTAPRRIGRPVVVLDVVGSTNDWIKNAAMRGAPEGLTVLALEQTTGRGRQGRAWCSARGKGIWMSVLLRPRMRAEKTPILGVMAALAVLDAVRSAGVERAVLKWPNDVMVGGRKIAGILVEPRIARINVDFAVLGIGWNLLQNEHDWIDSLKGTATSCLMEGVSPGYCEAAATLIESLDRWYERLTHGDWSGLTERWAAEAGTDLLPVD